MSQSAATLDVPDPGSFEVTFSFKNRQAYNTNPRFLILGRALRHFIISLIGLKRILFTNFSKALKAPPRIGVAPQDVRLDSTWEDGAGAPQRPAIKVPPVVDAGLFLCLQHGSLVLLNTSGQYDVSRYTHKIDSGSRLESVKVIFERSDGICKIGFCVWYFAPMRQRWGKLESTPSKKSFDVTTSDFNLDPSADYRPMPFFREAGWTKI